MPHKMSAQDAAAMAALHANKFRVHGGQSNLAVSDASAPRPVCPHGRGQCHHPEPCLLHSRSQGSSARANAMMQDLLRPPGISQQHHEAEWDQLFSLVSVHQAIHASAGSWLEARTGGEEGHTAGVYESWRLDGSAADNCQPACLLILTTGPVRRLHLCSSSGNGGRPFWSPCGPRLAPSGVCEGRSGGNAGPGPPAAPGHCRPALIRGQVPHPGPQHHSCPPYVC